MQKEFGKKCWIIFVNCGQAFEHFFVYRPNERLFNASYTGQSAWHTNVAGITTAYYKRLSNLTYECWLEYILRLKTLAKFHLTIDDEEVP